MNKDVVSGMESFFMALADKTRLRLLNLMREDEICVCFFTEVLEESQPKISRHLAYLRNAGIVEARRDGKWIHYRIVRPDDPLAAKVLEDTLEWLSAQEIMQKDYEKLTAVCCAPTPSGAIIRAPKPNIFVEADMFDREEELETYLL
jgi:ArsR family transcriptional regulator